MTYVLIPQTHASALWKPNIQLKFVLSTTHPLEISMSALRLHNVKESATYTYILLSLMVSQDTQGDVNIFVNFVINSRIGIYNLERSSPKTPL